MNAARTCRPVSQRRAERRSENPPERGIGDRLAGKPPRQDRVADERLGFSGVRFGRSHEAPGVERPARTPRQRIFVFAEEPRRQRRSEKRPLAAALQIPESRAERGIETQGDRCLEQIDFVVREAKDPRESSQRGGGFRREPLVGGGYGIVPDAARAALLPVTLGIRGVRIIEKLLSRKFARRLVQ